jgi:hypothetical protein
VILRLSGYPRNSAEADRFEETRTLEPRLLEDQAAFSPDGKFIVFVGTFSGNADIYRLPFRPDRTQSMKQAKNLTHNPAGDFRPAISPDGRIMTFSPDRDLPITAARGYSITYGPRCVRVERGIERVSLKFTRSSEDAESWRRIRTILPARFGPDGFQNRTAAIGGRRNARQPVHRWWRNGKAPGDFPNDRPVDSYAHQQCPSFRRITRAAGRQREGYDCSSIRGHQMNLGAAAPRRPAAIYLSDVSV